MPGKEAKTKPVSKSSPSVVIFGWFGVVMNLSIIGLCVWLVCFTTYFLMRKGSARRYWWVRQILHGFCMYVGIYAFLDKGKVFDDFLAQYFPPDQVTTVLFSYGQVAINQSGLEQQSCKLY
jgi:hypothetical protein